MKKKIVVSAFTLVLLVSSVFANKVEGINQKVLESFKKEFVDAREVSWQVSNQFSKVSFVFNEQVLFAYYSEDGERIALTRNIRSVDLPMSLSNDLKKAYGNYWISDLFEFHSKDENAYYVTVENADQRITLRSLGFDEWIIYKRTEKK